MQPHMSLADYRALQGDPRGEKSRVPSRMSLPEYRTLMANGTVAAVTLGERAKKKSTPAPAETLAPQKAPRRRRHEEDDLHRACMEWVKRITPEHPILKYIFHCPNGGIRHKGESGRMKSMGVKKGYPDLSCPRRSGMYTGLAVELKSSIGRLSPEQKDWLQALEEEGYLTGVCRTLDEFSALVFRYLEGVLDARLESSKIASEV